MTDKPYEPWHPITDSVDLKHIGKFVEECGEAAAIGGRCIIQGLDEHNVKEGKPNRQCLEDEIADLETNIELLKQRFGLDRERIYRRAVDKMPKLKAWHELA